MPSLYLRYKKGPDLYLPTPLSPLFAATPRCSYCLFIYAFSPSAYVNSTRQSIDYIIF